MIAIESLTSWLLRVFCALGFFFLIAPLLVIVPLAFNAGDFLTYPLAGFSLRWFDALFFTDQWLVPMKNSFVIGILAALLATVLGTAAAMALQKTSTKLRAPQLGIFLAPVVMPVAVVALGMYFTFVGWGIAKTFLGMILAHAAMGAPFVVSTVSATLKSYDERLYHAALSLGAPPALAFRKVTLPIILPGVLSGALFAFSVSFDDVVIALFVAGPDQRTLPLQMLSGMRENVSPAIAAVSLLMSVLAVALLIVINWLSGKSGKTASV